MKVLKYKEWRETCIALHMMLQMMGKVKLETMPPQPEWRHVVLFAEPDGFTTGLVPAGKDGFEIQLDLADACVKTTTASDASAFSFSGVVSVADLYKLFKSMLADVGHPCEINPIPQEMFTATPFDEQHASIDFDIPCARRAFHQFLFARNALERFSAPYRGKRTHPALYWGTFDMTTTLFSGKPCPYRTDGSLVERAAFDEQFIEFGFWTGDESTNDPSFFVLAYPFLTDGSSDEVRPRQAFFDPEQTEYFLRLEDVLKADDPQETVVRFCQDAFRNIAKRQQWDDAAWLFKPLLT